MASYNLVYTSFWSDTSTWSDDERVCALYLLTCRHRKAEGLYELPTAYAGHDMAWDGERFDRVLRDLIGRGWALRDGDWLMLANGLRHNPPKGEPQEKGAARAIEDVPRSSPLYAAFYAASERFAKGLHVRLAPPTDPIGGVPDGSDGSGNTPSLPHTPTPSQSPTPSLADADAREREAIEEWPEVEQALRQVPAWANALDRGASVACLALVQANRDVPWVQIASAAAASRLDVDAGLRTDSPRQALDMQLADHRAGRSTGAGERGTRRKPDKASWSGAGDLSRFDKPSVVEAA